MMKYFIVNADDFGLRTEINAGIIKGFREGIITSTSLMPAGEAFAEAVEAAGLYPQLGIGIHLTLVGGGKPVLPLTAVRSLCTPEGVFYSDYGSFLKAWLSGKIQPEDVRAELTAQIEKVQATGIDITHVDSHQHLHIWPGILKIVVPLCKIYGLRRIRIPAEDIFFTGGFQATVGRFCGRGGLTLLARRARVIVREAGFVCPEHFYGMLAGGHLNTEHCLRIIRDLPEGSSELMTHPGLDARKLAEVFPWEYHWEQELAALTAESVRNCISQQGVSLINFGGLDHEK